MNDRKRAPEPNNVGYARHGLGTVRPYLYGRLDMVEFLGRVFDAEILEKLGESENGFHVEARIGDSMVVCEASDPPPSGGTQSSVYVYVPDVDAAYQRALDFGATSISAPEDKSYGERGAGIKDSYGNVWWIATYTGGGRLDA